MPGIKELKTKIRSVQSTRKITRAMQMVSAAKMRKAQNAVIQSRSYVGLAWELIDKVSKQGIFQNPLTNIYPNAKKIGILLLTSNRGLVGSLNSNLIQKIKEIDPSTTPSTSLGAAQDDNSAKKEIACEFVTYGKKGQIFVSRFNKKLLADFPKLDKNVAMEDVYPIAKYISDLYETGNYKKIILIYSHFVSTLEQKTTVRQLLPFSEEVRQELIDYDEGDAEFEPAIIYEPSPKTVVEHLIPRILESQIYQTILESGASEHSARMVMMKNATESAEDLISDYTLTYNQLRQGKITTELAEITAGKIALE